MLKRIFVVDDSPDILALFTDLLTDEGYIVVTQAYPISGADEVRRAAPDLIIIDHWVHNQEVSQLTIERIRRNPDLAHIPIIICTGLADAPAVWAAARNQKNVSIISKPFDIDDLIDRVMLMIIAVEAERAKDSTQPIDVTAVSR